MDQNEIDSACAKLKTVLSALSEDSLTLHELSNLRNCCHHRRPGGGDVASLDHPALTKKILPTLVSELEDQMRSLKILVDNDNAAVGDMEQTLAAARQQNRTLRNLVNELPLLSPKSLKSAKNRKTDTSSSRKSKKKEPEGHASSTMTPSRSPNRSAPSPAPSTPNSATTKHRVVPIELPRISASELDSVPTTIRGRKISLAAVNEALEEIQRVCEDKYNPASFNRRQRQARLDYCSSDSHNSPHHIPSNNHNVTDPWISEHDLRQQCAFFRQEATARTALQIMRALKRVRQVPCKQGIVVYCLTSPTESLTFTC